MCHHCATRHSSASCPINIIVQSRQLMYCVLSLPGTNNSGFRRTLTMFLLLVFTGFWMLQLYRTFNHLPEQIFLVFVAWWKLFSCQTKKMRRVSPNKSTEMGWTRLMTPKFAKIRLVTSLKHESIQAEQISNTFMKQHLELWKYSAGYICSLVVLLHRIYAYQTKHEDPVSEWLCTTKDSSYG